jgi:hypothetical protein
MAERLRYGDPDVVGGLGDGSTPANAYSSLSALIIAEADDLDADNDYLKASMRSSSNGADTTAVSISGYTVSAADNIRITGEDFKHTGKWTTAGQVYRLEVDDAHCISIGENHTEVSYLQIGAGGTTNFRYGINFTGQTGGTTNIHHNIIRQMDSANQIGIYLASGGASAATTVNIYNNYIYGFASHAAIRCSDADFTGNLYNNTLAGNTSGIQRTDGTIITTNNTVFDNSDDFNGTMTIANCASDDGDGTNAQTLNSTSNYANEFTDYAGAVSDVSLVSGSSCIGNGTDDPGSGLYSDDIIDVLRSSTWDIGAFEFVAAAAGNPWYYMRHQGGMQ